MQINPHFREGRRRPWEARWWVNRKPRSKFFETQKERDRFIKEFQKQMGTHGEEVLCALTRFARLPDLSGERLQMVLQTRLGAIQPGGGR